MKYISPFNFGLLKTSENLTHLTFPKFLEFLNHYDCCKANILQGHAKMGYDVKEHQEIHWGHCGNECQIFKILNYIYRSLWEAW
jgi:hypothetical protein